MNEPKLFTLIRQKDESGISGSGRVLDGVKFHNGQVVICWRADINQQGDGYSSLGVYPSWEAFKHVHIDPHPENESIIIWGDQPNLQDKI